MNAAHSALLFSVCAAGCASSEPQPQPKFRGFGGNQTILTCTEVLSAGVPNTVCSPIPSPAVRAFGDNKFWVTLEPMGYVIGTTNDEIRVPKGFVTDFASIPQALWSLGLSPHGQYSRAAVVHDYLYWSQACTREQADRLLLLAMKESEVGGFDEWLVYKGVNRGGKGPWNKNTSERAAGLPRVIPEDYLRPADPNVKWPDYRTLLVARGIVDPPFEQRPKYCSYGNSTKVP